MTRLKNVKVVIADDERLMAEELQTLLLEVYPDLVIAGVAQDGEAALYLVGTTRPDIIFLAPRYRKKIFRLLLKWLGGEANHA